MDKELSERVRYLRDVMGFSFYQIGEEMGISRKRASRIYKGDLREARSGRGCILDRYRSLIVSWFKEYPSLRARQVYRWLRDRGVGVSYPLVAKYTREFRSKRERVYHPLEFLPGEEAQVDWSHIHHPEMGKLYCFVFILSYSRYLFAHVFPRSTFEFFIEGHLMAFSSIGGVPHSIRYDNLKSVVLRRRPHIQYNPRFLEFSRHYRVEIRLCNPARANEKGRVERVIRTLRTTFFNNITSYSTLSAINRALHEWVRDKNHTLHRTTGRRPVDMLWEERLRVLPAIPYRNVVIHPPVKPTRTGMMIFDTNTYSVPEYLVGRALSIHSTPTTVRIYDGDKEVASHPRSFERYKQIINPLHRSYRRLSGKAKMERIYVVIRDLHPDVREFLSQNEALGEDPKKTAYEIFKLLRHYSRGMLLSIIAECVRQRSARLRSLFAYLHIHSDEGDADEAVCPHDPAILNITYNARSLEEYEDE